MKSKVAIGVLSIACLVLLGLLGFQTYRLGVFKLHLQSDVKAPVGMLMQEIKEDLDHGRHAEAERKFRFLEQEWQKFRATPDFVEGLGNLLVKMQETPPASP